MDPQNPPPPSSVPPMPPPASGQPQQPAQPQGQPYPFRPGSTPIAHQPSEPAKPSAGAPKQEIVERLKQANNVLVTVSNNPSVDQLAACIGLTLMLNKLGKHATAVFSGAVPSTIEFLQPEKTIEKNTDSLRDFIIALDKAKADKLRYKVEDKYVKIFITPYKTSLSDKDLEFSQGDFNVEVVIALGVQQREQLDQAITAHGRILHDATVISVNNQASGELGAINWHESAASSLSELVVSLSESLQPGILDAQMATALLTGIVAETERFSNTKTSAVTMGIASQLMRSGANQQLIATKLETPPPPPPKPEEKEEPKEEDKPKEPPKPPEPPKQDDGSLQIPHEDRPAPPPPPPASDDDAESVSKINIDDQGQLTAADELPQDNSKIVLSPPSMGGTLTANTQPENEEPSADPLSLPPVDSPLLSHNPSTPSSLPSSDFGSNTAGGPSSIDKARDEVSSAAAKSTEDRLAPVASLGSKPIDLENNPPAGGGELNANGPASGNTPSGPGSNGGTAPPVPPPMMPPAAP